MPEASGTILVKSTIENGNLIYCEMDEEYEDCQCSYTYPPADMSESAIVLVTDCEYQQK